MDISKKAAIPDHLLNPVKEFDSIIATLSIDNPSQRETLLNARNNMCDRIMPNVFKFHDAKRVVDYCNDNNIICSFIAGDGRELKAWNTKNGNVHAKTDDEIRELWGEVYAKNISKAGGIMCRDQGDEFHIVLPGYSKDQARIFMINLELIAIEKCKSLGLYNLPSAKHEYGGLPIGSGIIDWGIAESKCGRMGEVERIADSNMAERKWNIALQSACKHRFNVLTNPINGKIIGFRPNNNYSELNEEELVVVKNKADIFKVYNFEGRSLLVGQNTGEITTTSESEILNFPDVFDQSYSVNVSN